jgi:hypothetical protein
MTAAKHSGRHVTVVSIVNRSSKYEPTTTLPPILST